MNKIILFTVLIFFGMHPALSCADIYKYKDENGVIHYTNMPGGEGYRKIFSEKKTRSKPDYDHIIHNASRKYDIEPSFIKALITVESNWDPEAVSKKGALGLMQLMPETAKDMSIEDPLNPGENIDGGTRYFRYLLDRFDEDIDLALAAYNAGPGKVEKSGGVPAISETKNFIRSVKAIHKSKTSEKVTRIYKVTYDDGTVLFTNVPFSHNQNISYKLSRF